MTDSETGRRPASDGPLAQAAYRVGYGYAGLCILFGVAALLGTFPGLGWLAQPFPNWPRSPVLSSIALLAMGVAVWTFLGLRYQIAFSASVIALATVLASLVVQVGALPIAGYAMPLASQVLVLAAAMPLVIVSARRKMIPEEVSLGIGGFVLLAVAATLFISRATGVTDSTADLLGAGPSLQLLVASFLFGGCYVALVWTRGFMSGESARWLPVAIGLAGLVTATVLWRGLASRENEQVTALARQAVDGQRRSLRNAVQVTAHSLQRAAEWRAAGATPPQQQRDEQALQRDIPGLDGMGWISALGVFDAAGAQFLTSADESAIASYVTRTDGLADSISYLPLDREMQRFVILAPACAIGACIGAVVGGIRTSVFFGSLLADTNRLFSYVLTGPAGEVAQSTPMQQWATRGWTQQLPLALGVVDLTLAASPRPRTVDRVRSNLPLLVLLLGYAVSGLAALSVAFAQHSLRTVRDVERIRISEALERSTDGIWEWDLTTGASVHSPGIWRYLGYEPDDVPPVRDAWLALVHPEDHPRLIREIGDHLTGARPSFDAEYRVLARDGRWHTIVDRGRVVDRTPDGRPVRMVGIKADVTVARSVEQARQAAEQRFREIFDSGFQYQLLLDHAGAVIEVNQHALNQYAVDSGQVRGRLVWDTLWWADNSGAQERLHDAIAAAMRGSTRRYEDEFPGPGLTHTYLEIALKPLTGDAEAPTQLLLEARDLTGRRRAEATLREVETLATMGRLAAQVAHEINNPLAGIQNSFLLIKGAIPTTHQYYSYVGAIEREIGRIAVVTRQLYETYRPEQETTGGAAVATVVGDAVAFLQQVNRQSGVRVQVESNGGPAILPVPGAMLRQIAYNLVQNAIEASPPGGIVVVRTSAHDTRFELRVRDRGPGIPLDAREQIFEPFYSTKSGRLRTGGMGLGLAMVRRTVAAAGGAITIEDVDGGGSDFVVTLPLTMNDSEN